MVHLLAHKLVTEIMQQEKSNGLINILRGENMSDEIVKKIIGDFVIAAGDTVSDFLLVLGKPCEIVRFLNIFFNSRPLTHHFGVYFSSQETKMLYKT